MNTNGAVKKTQRVELEGRGEITLRPSDHVATGGEGSVYKASSNTLVKIYSDTTKIANNNLVDKIKRLSLIKHPYIVSPQGLVFQNQKPIGFYMSFEKGEPLARVFTSSYRQRENFGDKEAIILADGMRTVVQIAHHEKAVLVDANEFNWLVSRLNSKVEPRIIDVDSWAIDRWKASVIMPSIRDWQTQGFNQASDWFSYAVVSFQIFSGIHPYKGMLDGYKNNEMERRMKDNKSVFSFGIHLNSAVRDFSAIPAPLLDWYRAVFQDGDRSTPPSPLQSSIKTPKAALVKKVIVSNAGDILVLDMLYDGVNDIPVKIFPSGVARFASGKLVNLAKKQEITINSKTDCEVITTEQGVLVAEIGSGNVLSCKLISHDGTATNLTTSIQAERLFRYQNRLFIVNEQGLVEITLAKVAKPIVLTGNIWPVMVNSTNWYDGLGVQDSLGAAYLVMPFAEKAVAYVRVSELDKQKVVEAKAGNRFAVVIALDRQTGMYEKYEFVFDRDYSSYQLTKTVVPTAELNMSFLPKGVSASIPEDTKLVIKVPLNGQEKLVNDQRIEASWILANWEDKVIYSEGKKIWSMKLK